LVLGPPPPEEIPRGTPAKLTPENFGRAKHHSNITVQTQHTTNVWARCKRIGGRGLLHGAVQASQTPESSLEDDGYAATEPRLCRII
jgi:hypothetical protein